MRKAPLAYLPLFALPGAATAYGPPPGFEDFEPIHQANFVQNLIELNKGGIVCVQELLNHLGIYGGSAGFSIIIWAACLKVLTSPMYEKALKYPT